MKEQSNYCIIFFMGELYLIGGFVSNKGKYLTLCYTFHIMKNIWNAIADLNVARVFAACTVFEGEIVVTWGENNSYDLKSVEAYDYYENKWTYLPDMIKERFHHAVVSMGNKL